MYIIIIIIIIIIIMVVGPCFLKKCIHLFRKQNVVVVVELHINIYVI